MAIVLDKRQNVPRQVYNILRERIQSVELAPGASINERSLAQWLGVSRTPIREAVRQLADDGLIEIKPNVGTFVALVDPSRISEHCLIRTSLECVAIEQAVGRFDERAERQLLTLIAQQEETIEQGDMATNIHVDSEFHRLIVRLSGYRAMEEILRKVMGEIIRARHLSIMLPGRLREPIDEHILILEALRSGDAKRCVDAIRFHLDESYASILSVTKTNPEFLTNNEPFPRF